LGGIRKITVPAAPRRGKFLIEKGKMQVISEDIREALKFTGQD
jgi:hypothetical protein